MKSADLPRFQHIPEPQNEALPQPTLGLEAVQIEEQRVHSAIAGDRAAEKLAILDQLENKNVPDPRYLESVSPGRIAVRQIFRRPFSSESERTALSNWLDTEIGPEPYYTQKQSLQEQIPSVEHAFEDDVSVLSKTIVVRENLRNLTAHEKESIENRLAGEDLPEIFKDWKDIAEANKGEKISWVDWLTTEPKNGQTPQEAAGATPEQLLNVVQWNTNRLFRQNADPETRQEIAAFTKRTQEALEAAVEEGELSPALLEQFQKASNTVVVKGDVLDKKLAYAKGYVTDERDVIVIGSDATFSTVAHELLHDKGGFQTRWINEGETERYTNILAKYDAELRGEPVPDDAVYKSERTIMSDIRALSGISDVEMSELYTGRDSEQNEDQLRQLVQDRTGLDLIGYARDFEERSTNAYVEQYKEEYMSEVTKAIHEGAEVPKSDAPLRVRLAVQNGITATMRDIAETTNAAYDHVMNNVSSGDKIEALNRQIKILFSAKIEAFYANDKPADATIEG